MEGFGRLVLIGPMAVGKSAVGRMVAQRSGVPCVDTDRLIADRHGRISRIFETDGEQAFRQLEAEVVREALSAEDVVVSLGGGAVLHPDTQDLLRRVTVAFLDTDLATVRLRISGDTGRPLLAGNPEDRWQELYDRRRPVYAQLATFTVDTRGRSVRACADAVLAGLAHRRPPAPHPGSPEGPSTTTSTPHPPTERVTAPHDH